MTDVLEAIALLDAVLGVPTKEQALREGERYRDAGLRSLGLDPLVMSGIMTKGCSRCGGTMYKTTETNGSSGPWICQNPSCGAME